MAPRLRTFLAARATHCRRGDVTEQRQPFDALRLFRAYAEFVDAADAWANDTGDTMALDGFRKMLLRDIEKTIGRAKTITPLANFTEAREKRGKQAA